MTDQPPSFPVAPAPRATETGAGYRVLARKYRPMDFSQLCGQPALVRTLTNAIASGRIAQAFMLTGVRGVGKTTTARIIARALNCIGPDGSGGPTATPCGQCEPCRTIAEDRHVDVLEMDAASNNSVENIREVIDSVRYGPVAARYKVYIVDEVHMLSKPAFNALLKTLEEPPAHTKFIFATTEIRKVPVTVLSRCQRFDLRRIDSRTLVDLLTRVAAAEGIAIEPDALALVARAADGSARDGLSLLDQAIALGGAHVTAAQVRDMLGLADRAVIVDLLEAATSGRPAAALDVFADLHRAGADPLAVVQDLLNLTHVLTRLKVVPGGADDPATPEIERVRGGGLAAKLSLAALARAWQMLLKGLAEAQAAPVPHQAVEMLIVRLAYAANLPSPAELVRQFQGEGAAGGSPAASATGTPRLPPAAEPASAVGGGSGRVEALAVAMPSPTEALAAGGAEPMPDPQDFRSLVALFAERREGMLYGHLYGNVHLVRFEPGLVELRPGGPAPANLANRVAQLLKEWTGRRWMVSVSGAPGEPTLSEQDREAAARAKDEASRHPVVRAVLEAFPGARIEAVRDLADNASGAGGDPVANEGDPPSALDGTDEEGEL